jgi:hypothetical protein
MKGFSIVLTRFEDKVNTVRYKAILDLEDGMTVKGGLISDLYISWSAFEGAPRRSWS